jgi:hypothetical protein
MIFYNTAILEILQSDFTDLSEKFDFNVVDNLTCSSRRKLFRVFKKVASKKISENGVFEIEYKDKSVKYLEYYFWFSTNSVDSDCVIGRISDITMQKLRRE